MRRRSYTILVLGGGQSRFRKLHLSRNFLVSVASIVGLLLLAAFAAPQLMLRARSSQASLDELSRENDRLKAESERFQGELDRMAGRLNGFETRAGRLAAELGIEELSDPEAAAGGAGSLPGGIGFGVVDELRILRDRADLLGDSLDVVDRVFQTRMRLLASTPNQMPVHGWFSHGFGWRKDPWTGKREFHRGIDIVVDAGTDVLAPADGVVSQAARKSDYGKMIDLSHGYGIVSRYAHLSETLVKPGQRVRRGDVIGRVGSTGRSTGPHLHYEVFRDGRRVNPWKYLGQKGS